jgi:hypothetical protein
MSARDNREHTRRATSWQQVTRLAASPTWTDPATLPTALIKSLHAAGHLIVVAV